MKIIKQILNFLIFRRILIHITRIPELELLKQLNLYTKNNGDFEGEVTKDGFKLFYISGYVKKATINLPLVDISGVTTRENKQTKLSAKITLNIIPKVLFFAAFGLIILLYFLDKYTESDFGGISDTTIPLYTLPFGCLFLILRYYFESESCKNQFQNMIETIEKVNDNEL